jgi:hypothetical protein
MGMKMTPTEEIKVLMGLLSLLCSWKQRQKQELTDQITTINVNAS